VGDEVDLMIDGQLFFSYEEAYQIGRLLEDLQFRWFEDPVRHTDFDGLDRLCRELRVPVAVFDHPSWGFFDAAQMVRRNNSLRILRGDCGKSGITGLKKLCSVAEAFGLNCEVHAAGLPNLHVILSIENCAYYEDMISWYTGPNQVADHGEMIIDEEGLVSAPDAPGVGVSFDPDEIDVIDELS
jgi:L-alanine-DL-glutamate epimerase-like enolase superfamily enzyme